MYRRILLALDPEGLAERALPVVEALARRSLGEVVVVSVRDGRAAAKPDAAAGPDPAGAVARLESEGVRARAEVLSTRGGNVASVLAEAARRLHPDLVALGSHGRGDLAELVRGGVGHRVAASVDSAVLLVSSPNRRRRAPAAVRADTAPRLIRRLLVAVDDSEAAAGAIETAAELACEHEPSVLVVHALEGAALDRYGYDAALEAANGLVARAARQLEAPGRVVGTRLLTGPEPAAGRLAEAAERWDADLIVLGSRRLTDLRGLLLGSVAHDLLRRTRRPILLTERRPGRDR